MDFESILEGILLVRGQGNLKLKPKQKEGLQAIVFERSRATLRRMAQQESPERQIWRKPKNAIAASLHDICKVSREPWRQNAN